VSGVGPGTGRSVALACAREGADVVLAAATVAAVEEVAARCGRAAGARSPCRRTSRASTTAAARDAARAELGRIDVLVNNAFRSAPYDAVERASMDDWRQIFDVNVFGSIQLSQAVIPHMRAQRGGSIVMINSMSVRVIEPRFGGYAASKGALMTAMQTMAKELGNDGIRVNASSPATSGVLPCSAGSSSSRPSAGTTPEAIYAEIAARTALNHIPDSDEIADAVVFFASDLSRAITGQALDVNGGHYFH
jgi:NAD(P)-dependent dehydrogenase (short-subunit alcohol dehydrogenase family)